MKHEIHYEFYFFPEAPTHMPLLQSFESLCRDHKTLVCDFIDVYPLWWFFCRDKTSNIPIHSLVSASPLYVGLHIVFADFGQPASYLSKPLKFIDILQSNT